MKRYFILLLAVVSLCGCSPKLTHPASTLDGSLDYRPYVEKGFYISPNAYTGDCVVLGELSLVVIPEVITKDEGHKMNIDKSLYEKFEYGAEDYRVKKISPEELLEKSVETAKAYGANGISEYKVTAEYLENTLATVVKRYVISGLMIKR